MAPTRQHVIISANPKSGPRSRTELVHQLKTRIQQSGFDCEVYTDLELMAARARELRDQCVLRTIVAAGGDGTASTVSSLAPIDVPITLFPTGSENLLANYLEIRSEVDDCVASILAGKTRKMDVMMVENRFSLLMASIGYDAEVVRRVHQSRRSHITRWTYWIAILITLVKYRWPTLKIVVQDANQSNVETIHASWVFVFNIPKYAAGLSIVDDTVDNDGLLDVGMFGPGGLIHGLWCYWQVARGRHQQLATWRRFRTSSIRIECERGVSSCQADGDWVGNLPVSICVASRTVEFFVPETRL